MAIIHVVLNKFNGKQASNHYALLQALAKSKLEGIPGLKRVNVGPPLASTKGRSKDWDSMLVAELESVDALKVYIDHPSHLEYKDFNSANSSDILAFDIETETTATNKSLLHVVFAKLKEVPEGHIEKLQSTARGMVGQIPGLERCDVGAPLELTKARAGGWDVMLYAELDSEKALEVYAPHPVHEEYKLLNKDLGTDVLAFDLDTSA